MHGAHNLYTVIYFPNLCSCMHVVNMLPFLAVTGCCNCERMSRPTDSLAFFIHPYKHWFPCRLLSAKEHSSPSDTTPLITLLPPVDQSLHFIV